MVTTWIDDRTIHRRLPSETADRILRNQKLHRLHDWLQANIKAYVGLYEKGSVVVGDPWVEGRSDRDVLVLLDGSPTTEQEMAIGAELEAIGFNDTYLFNLGQKQGFLRASSHHDITMKFRGVALFGENLLAEKETPSREFARSWADAGLRTLPGTLRVRAVNGRFWSLDRMRDELYCDLKLMFMFLADKKYAESGYYPTRREDVAHAFGSAALRELARRLTVIDEADRESLIGSARLALDVMRELMAADQLALTGQTRASETVP